MMHGIFCNDKLVVSGFDVVRRTRGSNLDQVIDLYLTSATFMPKSITSLQPCQAFIGKPLICQRQFTSLLIIQ